MSAYAKAATAALAARWGGGGHDGGPYGGHWAWPHNWVSPLGTPDWNHMPSFLDNNPLPQGYPWGGKTAKNTNYYQETPNTGVTRHYTWSIDRVPCNPDGLYENTCLLINNQFPGPTIEANWGDWIEVTITNNIPDEGTAIHWHGLLQKATPYMDGVPGNTQCPIAPGATFTYRFQADLYGSTWYHSHYSAQYGSGLFGPLVIYGPKNVDYDSDLGPVMISDYFHEYYHQAVEKTLAPLDQAGPPLANNNLINGKASNGPTPMASFDVTSGKTYRMRLINPSSASVQKFSIDGYKFTIFANDFVPIDPYETDVVTLGVGQRSDILFKATGKSTDAVWMRGFRPPPCGPSAGGEEVQAAIFYEDADRTKLPNTTPGPNAYNSYCGNDPLSQTVPYYPMSAGEPTSSEVLNIEFRPNGTALLWYFNNQTFRVNYNDPILLEAKLGNLDFPEIESVHNYGTNKSVRFILENPGNQPHPMHLHGHNIFVLAEGSCPLGESSDPGATVIPSAEPVTSTPAATAALSSAAADYGSSSATSSAPSGHKSSSAKSSAPAGYGSSSATSSSAAAASSAPGNYTEERDINVDYGKKSKRQQTLGSCWDGSIVNAENPQRRDVQMLLPGQYIVIQWFQDNPGVWPLHCHIAWHLSAGMVWMVLEDPDGIADMMQIPSTMSQTCRDWSAYTGENVVQQIDDGI